MYFFKKFFSTPGHGSDKLSYRNDNDHNDDSPDRGPCARPRPFKSYSKNAGFVYVLNVV